MNQAQIRELTTLFEELFTQADLRRWLRNVPDGKRIVNSLPETANLTTFCFNAIDTLRRHGVLQTQEFWNEFEEAAPDRIRAHELRTRFGFASADQPPAPPPATPPAASVAPAPSASSSSPIVVLLVSASPDTHERIRVDKEFRTIIDKIRGTKFRELFKVVQISATRFEDLQTALHEHSPHILHISSHGNESGALRFEAGDNGSGLVSKKRMLRLLKALSDNFRAIIVNACHSSALICDIPAEIGVPAIGMNTAVADSAAIAFSSSFYESLSFGKSIEKAFDVALSNIEDAESDEVDPDDDDDADPASEAAEQIDIPELFPPADNDPKGLRKLVLVK